MSPNETSALQTDDAFQTEEIKPETQKWYNNKTKFWLSLLFWPLFIYAFIKTNLFPKKTKWIIAGAAALLIIIMPSGSSMNSPDGKGFISSDKWTEFEFGDYYKKRKNRLTLNKEVLDGSYMPSTNIHREGTYAFDGSTISCRFDDGLPPYTLQYKKKHGTWCVIDEEGTIYYYDNPKDRLK